MVYIPQTGQIAGAVCAILRSSLGADRVQQELGAIRHQSSHLLVVAIDTYGHDSLEHWERIARARNLRMLCVQVHSGEAVIGPEFALNRPGCVRCWLGRYYNGRGQGQYFAQMSLQGYGPSAEDPWLTPVAASMIGRITADRVLQVLNSDGHTDSDRNWKVYYLDLKTLTGREGLVLPDYACPHCSHLPFDSAEAARFKVTSLPKPYPEADRLRDVEAVGPAAQQMYVGRRAGIVPEVNTAWRFRHGAVAIADLPLFNSNKPEPCSGFADRLSVARTTAVLEAIERYSGLRPRSRRPAIYSNVASLGNLAVDPTCFGLYSESDYKANADLLTPYSDQLGMEFVWAYSCVRQEPVLIPRQLGFYSHDEQTDPRFVIEGSNGCSLGSYPEEAILHGILEVVERDAFLLTWYAQRRPPRLDLIESLDPEIRCRYRLLQRDGFQVHAFDITTEFGIPAVWLMATCCERQMPYAACISAAHLRPEPAIRKGLRELGAVLNRCILDMDHEDMRHRAMMLAEAPDQVRKAIDHALFYCVPESAHHLEFLLESNEVSSLRDMESRSRELWSEDLGDELRHTIDRILSSGTDVIIVNQTAPEQAPLGLHTYKALIPGTIPMSCGQRLRRLEGLDRLTSALERMSLSQPNPAPHPFT